MNTLEMLKRGRERVAKGWCQFALAQDAKGLGVDSDGGTAVKWCALGALGEAYDMVALRLRSSALDLLEEALSKDDRSGCSYSSYSVVNYNNRSTTKQLDIIALFDRAIAKLEPIQRSTQEMVADLMTKVMGERIPEEQKDTINT